ncbi:sensor histidine kinase [Streptomyces sp. NRRL S-350]|uniref:sensor histidine kinase n=1 Tax=Streptomyces sp. NRRL S-350 TaxID=1463902 RepID=UPI00055ABF58|nr:histidine kinase [Streptomyces sp. NRRL S-350]
MWGTEWEWAAVAVAGAACAVAGGLAVALGRARRLYRAAIGERGWLLERERESAARTAVDAERARIAAELHDIVSHNVSLMVVQAGAAREVLATMPEEAAAAMTAVESAGRDAMTELRHLLGLLAPAADGSEEPDGDGFAPQPSLGRLSPLIDRFAFAGLPVEVRVSGEPRPLPGGIDVTAYRIVQEALTNALKHGDGGTAEVTVRYADHYLRVEVLNSGPSVLSGGGPAGSGSATADGSGSATAGGSGSASGPSAPAQRPADGAGRGLIGLRERVAVYGGDLDARRRLGGGYRVRARIPLDRP